MKSQPVAKVPIAVNAHLEINQALDSLLQTVRACRVCEAHLPLDRKSVV